QPYAPTGDRIFERLGRPAKLDRGASLGFGQPDRSELRVVEPVQHQEVGAGIDDRDRYAPFVRGGFGFGRRHDLLRRRDRDRFAVRRGGRRHLVLMHRNLAWESGTQTAAGTEQRSASTVVRRKAASARISSLLSDA